MPTTCRSVLSYVQHQIQHCDQELEQESERVRAYLVEKRQETKKQIGKSQGENVP